jgi:hypothetical protein
MLASLTVSGSGAHVQARVAQRAQRMVQAGQAGEHLRTVAAAADQGDDDNAVQEAGRGDMWHVDGS